MLEDRQINFLAARIDPILHALRLFREVVPLTPAAHFPGWRFPARILELIMPLTGAVMRPAAPQELLLTLHLLMLSLRLKDYPVMQDYFLLFPVACRA